MKRILLIKLTSLGDLLHALPALNDAYRADPEIEFDWAIDRSFSEVAAWHPAVKRLFPTSHRHWRKNLGSLSTYRSVKELIHNVREVEYDLVIDGQGNFKTALLSLLARGKRAGFDRHSVREWIAHFAYQKKCAASKKAHAIDRLRALFAQAIGYPLPQTPPDFSLKENCFTKPPFELPSSYLVFVHSAGWKTKLWPEEHWKELIKKAIQRGFHVLLPWGSPTEEQRAHRLAIIGGAKVLPRLPLSQMGYILQHAAAAVCMDTGLSHLVASLGVPSITLYGPTNPELIGSSGPRQSHLRSTLPCSPCNRKQCQFQADEAPCLAQITADAVFRQLMHSLSITQKS